MRALLILSLLVNFLFAMAAYQHETRYNALLAWACQMGNGGYECGEE